MTILDRLKKDLERIDELMEINQSLKTAKERNSMGFQIIYDLRKDIETVIEKLEHIY